LEPAPGPWPGCEIICRKPAQGQAPGQGAPVQGSPGQGGPGPAFRLAEIRPIAYETWKI
jgi:hypothetical protein